MLINWRVGAAKIAREPTLLSSKEVTMATKPQSTSLGTFQNITEKNQLMKCT